MAWTKPYPPYYRLTVLIAIGLGLLCFVLLNTNHTNAGRFLKGQNEFVGFYIGGVQLGTSHLYSYAENQTLVRQLLGVSMENIAFVRPPFHAVLLRPLALLPFPVAYWTFQFTMLAALVWFVRQFMKECPELAVFIPMAPAVLVSLSIAQDTLLLLVIVACSILLFRNGREFPCGLVLSLCAIKFHLFLLIPILMVLKRRWNCLAGLTAGGFLLMQLGVVFGGLGPYADWIHMIRNPTVSPSEAMTSLCALGNAYGGQTLAAGAILGVVAVFIWLCRRTDDFEFLFGVALIAGLLINVHSYLSDSVLLLLAFILIKNTNVRLVLTILLSPLAYFLLFAGSTIPYVLVMLSSVVIASLVTVPTMNFNAGIQKWNTAS